MIVHIKTVNGVLKAFKNIRETKDYKELLIQKAMVSIKLICKGMFRTRRYGGLKQKHTNLLRIGFTMMAVLYDNTEKREID